MSLVIALSKLKSASRWKHDLYFRIIYRLEYNAVYTNFGVFGLNNIYLWFCYFKVDDDFSHKSKMSTVTDNFLKISGKLLCIEAKSAARLSFDHIILQYTMTIFIYFVSKLSRLLSHRNAKSYDINLMKRILIFFLKIKPQSFFSNFIKKVSTRRNFLTSIFLRTK